MTTSQNVAVAAPSRLTIALGFQAVHVGSLAEALAKVRAFVKEHDIAAAEYGDTTGRITRDDVPYVRVSYHGKIWMLDEKGRECYREVGLDGTIAP